MATNTNTNTNTTIGRPKKYPDGEKRATLRVTKEVRNKIMGIIRFNTYYNDPSELIKDLLIKYNMWEINIPEGKIE